jgi:hypothetical protein
MISWVGLSEGDWDAGSNWSSGLVPGANWVPEPTSVVDTLLNTITATPDHFSQWAILGEELSLIFLPLVMLQ